ncbi:hypothetical protein OIU85_007852, partial [Salix viminalis]
TYNSGQPQVLETADITWHNLPTPQFMPDWSPVKMSGFMASRRLTRTNIRSVILVIILESISLLSTTEKLCV